MIFKDSEGNIGLFYFIDDKFYGLIMSLDEGNIDSMNEIQPLDNHETLLSELQYGPSFSDLREEMGYDLSKATVWTFPRGRVWYNMKDHSFTISSSRKILETPFYLNIVKQQFGLENKKIHLNQDNEYENYDEEYLQH